ncbi:hypothetical protein [Marinobacter xestospongiae]|uniref:Uncharacterized protein n=1 Tax=Marinobacter xestospongiae TaxID=994319 RepID=A0ABU3W2E0_9GAMM|nr:hypothetical protein [Marinobacter xestospongiae]MDV2080703.1 hypothetical protein [Marinobacter xestospongiae]
MNIKEFFGQLATEVYEYSFSLPEVVNKKSLYYLASLICDDLGYEQAPENSFGLIKLSREDVVYDFKVYLHHDDISLKQSEEMLELLETSASDEYYVTFSYERLKNDDQSGHFHSVQSGSGYSVLNDFSPSYCMFLVSDQLCRVIFIRWED